MTIWFPYTHSVVPNYKIKTTFLDNLVSDGVITTISFLKHLLWLLQQVFFLFSLEKDNRPHQDSNLESPDSWSDALSIGPRGHTYYYFIYILYH